ncbi:MAG: DUF5916 domain-containing protein [candidate division Zixibacteria bacterium]
MRVSRQVIGILALSTLLLIGTISAGDAENEERIVPELKAYRINPHPPKIDGLLDDAVWQSRGVEFARDFIQRIPDEGELASESTLVAVVYDDEAIYFAFWNYDSEPDKIQKQLVRRDRYAETDWVAVRIDPYHDHQTGYDFTVTSAGVQRDISIYNDSWTDNSWNSVWESSVQMQPWGWSAEVKIPYHCLRFPEKEEHTWGIDFTRWINRNNEGARWAFTPVSEGGYVSKFGHLSGLTNIKPVRHLEIMPYVVSSTEFKPSTLGNPNGKDFFGNTGIDIKYGLTSNLTLDATINPDFGQVELDRPVLNLSAFETYFPERRPFFIEGSSLFDTQFGLFYSRRIGRQPRGYAEHDSLLYSTDRPDASSIIGAAKITGKLSNGTSLAFLTAQTAEEQEEFAVGYIDTIRYDDNGEPIEKYVETGRQKQTIEPTANYSVLRLKQDIFNNSYVGVMFTNASQKSRDPANAGGVDWRLNANNNSWGTNGQLVYSKIDGQKTGFGFYGEIKKLSGKHWLGAAYIKIINPHLNLNHLGRTTVNGLREGAMWIQYRTDDPWWIFRRTWNNFNMYMGWTYDGYNYKKGSNYNFQAEFTNYWSLGGGFNIQADEYAPWELRGNGIWEWPNNPIYSWWASLNTDSRKKLNFNINPGSGGDREGHWWANYIGFNYRPASNMEVSLGANVHKTVGTTHWVENVDETNASGETITTSIFGTRFQDRFTPGFTFSYVPSPKISIQFSAQTLITSVSHSDFRYYRDGKNYEALTDDPDVDSTEAVLYESLNAGNNYNYSAINSTLLLRWEYLPGSTLYLVWTRSRPEVDMNVNNLDVSRDLKKLFSGNDNNLFLIKASYWWNI